jgi:peptidyl-prolyl cis-trans isomerase C
VRELLLQEARRARLQPDAATDAEGRRETEEEALIRGLIESRVAIPSPDEESCRRYYENNRARFRSDEIHEASHILLAARRDDEAAFAAARERALALIASLETEPHRFAEIARVHSDCPSAAAGGNLGQLTRGATTPPFEQALLGLEPGEMTKQPVETRYGLHIIRLDRRIPGVLLPFEAVRERIAAYLAERTHRMAVAQFVARLAARAEVTGVELPTPGDLRVY